MIFNLSNATGSFANLFCDLRNFFKKTEHETENSRKKKPISVSRSVFSKKFLRSKNRLVKVPVSVERLKITFTNSNVNFVLFL